VVPVGLPVRGAVGVLAMICSQWFFDEVQDGTPPD